VLFVAFFQGLIINTYLLYHVIYYVLGLLVGNLIFIYNLVDIFSPQKLHLVDIHLLIDIQIRIIGLSILL